MLVNVLTAAVLVWVGSRLVVAARLSLSARTRSRVVALARGLRPHHFLLALPLSIGGWYCTVMYLRGYREGGREQGLAESARAHLAYNMSIIGLVIVALALGT